MEFGEIIKIVVVAVLGAAISLFVEKIYKKRKMEQKKAEAAQSAQRDQSNSKPR